MPGELEGLPETIGRYQVRGLLGRGGMGRVVAGHDPVLRRDVAIKLVEPAAVSLEDLAELRYLFHREARATAALRHPNILEVFDYSGPEADLMFIAVELIDGATLAQILTQRTALPARMVAAVGYELAGALDAAHAQSIVHRDLKPENVFWTPAGRIVLSDFGIAKAFDGSDRLGGTIQFGGTNLYGSPSYMAPEQLGGGEVSHLSDLYALGTVLYECLVGQQVFGGNDIQAILDAVVAGDHTPVQELVAAPKRLGRLVESLLQTAPEERPATAREVADELRLVLDEVAVTDPRLCLRHGGALGFDADETAMAVAAAPKKDTEDEAEEERGLFDARPRQGIRIPTPRRTWSRLATKGPVFLGMLAVIIVIGAGVQLFRQLTDRSDRRVTVVTEIEPTISTDAAHPPTRGDATDVFVLLEFRGRQTISIDGAEVGTWSDRIRLALPPGRHTLEARSTAGTIKRDVLLIEGTQPAFELFER